MWHCIYINTIISMNCQHNKIPQICGRSGHVSAGYACGLFRACVRQFMQLLMLISQLLPVLPRRSSGLQPAARPLLPAGKGF